MPTVTKTMSLQQIEKLYNRSKPFIRKESRPQYTYWQIHTQECTITAYTSGKVVFQGADLDWLKEGEKEKMSETDSLTNTYPMAGSDEVGTGDYFGPIVVASVIVENKETAQKLKDMKITDSKAMTDQYIQKIAPAIQKLVPYSVQILKNEQYNRIYDKETMNINRIKSRMHNQAYLNLQAKGYALPDLRIIDQFCQPSAYYSHLKGVPVVVDGMHFETKSESRYIAVAAASVLARNAFLEYWKAMEEKYGFHFEKGAGAKVDACAREYFQSHPLSDLPKIAKIHFANTRKALPQYEGSL